MLLASEAVEGTALPLECIDDIHGGDGLAASVLCVGDGVTDDILEEDLEDTARLFVDEAADTLDASTPRQPSDRRLRDPLDVIPQYLTVPLRSSFSQTLASFSSS